eukprot:CAMPEP_0181534428 /NCGR_PEP_ID=MMETSP1110-20121109/73739_1 /TAXON_ID=174948 /ORGANISM="Symbiodinium sp., Strain CCMP421" /LENGTH=131 /DNA_ID=CAMNT_0023665785 /DNA_START=596 /DNA_END=987 /DNA_ORIENTATION=-
MRQVLSMRTGLALAAEAGLLAMLAASAKRAGESVVPVLASIAHGAVLPNLPVDAAAATWGSSAEGAGAGTGAAFQAPVRARVAEPAGDLEDAVLAATTLLTAILDFPVLAACTDAAVSEELPMRAVLSALL